MAENEILPVHVGIIMDGNGRWAKKRGLPRTAGHVQGAKTFKKCVEACRKRGIKVVTFYTFSTENWKRPASEVNAIMKLFSQYLDDAMEMTKENAKFIFLGDPAPLSDELKRKIEKVTLASQNHEGIVCCIAIEQRLYTSGLPPVDLIIRPSGEQRLSNFLIWQAAYAEYVFMDVLWPDFGEKDLDFALSEYAKRNRRYGGI